MENLDIFASNGFGLTVDEDAPYGQGEKIRLIAMPVSKETTFDEKGEYFTRLASKGRKLTRNTTSDLKELIFLLQEQYIGTMVRCKKARAMFAMRACRKSVMFGHALSQKQMVSVTRHMGEIEHPWVCQCQAYQVICSIG
jgi:DNA mismatch repair protein PMS2